MRRNRFWLLLLFWLPFATACAADEQDDKYAEGIDYALVTPPLPTAGEEGVQVMELFWYGCPHCYQFEPYLHQWQESKPEAARFERMPAIFSNPRWRLHAQAFFTADVLGVQDRIHAPLMKAIHEQKQPLDTKQKLQDFFVAHGVEAETFAKTFDSFAVMAKVNRAADITKRSGIDGVPAIVVAGKYRISGSMAGSFRNMLDIVNFLVAKEAGASR